MKEEIQDPRPLLLSQVNLHATRVEFIPDHHVVLLCGGKVPIKLQADDPEPPTASLRHALSHADTDYEFYRPEEITDWHTDGTFKNLMSFEQDLAGICSLVAIILESPGAIAELGAFSQLPELNKKILAIKSRVFVDSPSFINLGILRYIREINESSVRNYEWDIHRPEQISRETVDDVALDIKEELDKISRSVLFRVDYDSHVTIAICELIHLFHALKETEIVEYLSSLGVVQTRDSVKRKLFLLERFQLLKKETYSDATFYLSGRYGFHKLRISLNTDSVFDALRARVSSMDFYKRSTGQRNRLRTIERANIGGLR